MNVLLLEKQKKGTCQILLSMFEKSKGISILSSTVFGLTLTSLGIGKGDTGLINECLLSFIFLLCFWMNMKVNSFSSHFTFSHSLLASMIHSLGSLITHITLKLPRLVDEKLPNV